MIRSFVAEITLSNVEGLLRMTPVIQDWSRTASSRHVEDVSAHGKLFLTRTSIFIKRRFASAGQTSVRGRTIFEPMQHRLLRHAVRFAHRHARNDIHFVTSIIQSYTTWQILRSSDSLIESGGMITITFPRGRSITPCFRANSHTLNPRFSDNE